MPAQNKAVKSAVRRNDKAILITLAIILFVVAIVPQYAIILPALLLMMAIHELGHLIVAKLVGMRVLAMFLGMGPHLWSIKKNGIEYGFKAFPIGAYVSMLERTKDNRYQTMNHQAKLSLFGAMPHLSRVLVGAAGPAANFLFAFLLFLAPGGLGLQIGDAMVGLLEDFVRMISFNPPDDDSLLVGTRTLGNEGAEISMLEAYGIANIVVGLFNLLPFPPLDGGRIAISIYEKTKSAKHIEYRLRGDTLKKLTYAGMGVTFLMLLMFWSY